jgi:hypothetical protein
MKRTLYIVEVSDGYVDQNLCAFLAKEEAEKAARAFQEMEDSLVPSFGYKYRVEEMGLFDSSEEIRPVRVYAVRVDKQGRKRSRWQFMAWQEEGALVRVPAAAASDTHDGGALGYSTSGYEEALEHALAFLRERQGGG